MVTQTSSTLVYPRFESRVPLANTLLYELKGPELFASALVASGRLQLSVLPGEFGFLDRGFVVPGAAETVASAIAPLRRTVWMAALTAFRPPGGNCKIVADLWTGSVDIVFSFGISRQSRGRVT